MSTAPMHRPFLVGHDHVGHDLSHDNSDEKGLPSQSAFQPEQVHRGLFLVYESAKKKAARSSRIPSAYRIASIVAALFLIMTIV